VEYLKNKSIVGNHYYRKADENNYLHVNHLHDGGFLINSLREKSMDVMKNPAKYGIFDDSPEMKLIVSNKDEFESALRKAIFGLDLFKYVKST
jgi:hypothetical protein